MIQPTKDELRQALKVAEKTIEEARVMIYGYDATFNWMLDISQKQLSHWQRKQRKLRKERQALEKKNAK